VEERDILLAIVRNAPSSGGEARSEISRVWTARRDETQKTDGAFDALSFDNGYVLL
jgi:hypothetical protein